MWKAFSECVPCVCIQAGRSDCVYRTASCDKLRIMRLLFIWTHQTSSVSHTSHDKVSLFFISHPTLLLFLFLPSSTSSNVWHFDTEHPISICSGALALHADRFGKEGLSSLPNFARYFLTSLLRHYLNCCLMLLEVSFYTAGTAEELD